MITKIADFTCERCFEVFASKQNLHKHLTRKFLCTPLDTNHNIDVSILKNKLRYKNKTKFICQICENSFATKQSLDRHIFKCNESKQHSNIEKELEQCKEHIKSLEDKLNATISQNDTRYMQTIENNINTIQITNNFQILLNNFGNEKTDHLTNQFLDTCLLGLKTGMKNLLREIHFNPNVPENHNVRSLSKKQNTLEFFSDGSWHPCDKNNTLDQMIRNGYKILFKHFLNNHIDTNSQEQQQRNEHINEYLTNLLRKEGNSYYELRRDLYMLILDGNFYIIGK